MPLLHTGAIKTSPIPQTMQADVPTATSFIWENAKESDGTPYSLTDLIEDITAPIKGMIKPGAKDWKTSQINGTFEKFITNFNEAILTDVEKKDWMDKWNEAFQINPTEDISHKISIVITDGLGTIDDGKGWLFLASEAPNGNAKLLELIRNAVTKFFNNLKSNTPDFIDIPTISKMMDDEIDADLKPLHLNLKDDGLDYIKQIKEEALDGIESDFQSSHYQTTTANRPYRIFGQQEAKDKASKSFELKFHTQNSADVIAKAAFNKAVSGSKIIEDDGTVIENLQDILNGIPNSFQFDSRFVLAVPKIIALGNDKLPVEVVEKLLGKDAGDKYLKWFDEWKWLIQSTLNENFDKSDDPKKITISLKLKDKVEVIKAKDAHPSFATIAGSKPLTQDVSTSEIPVQHVSYIADLFKNGYDQLVSELDARIATVSEDDLIKLFGHNLIVNEIKQDVLPSELKDLSSAAFGNLQKLIDDSFKVIEDNLKTLYPRYKYNRSIVKITFDIKYLLFPDGTHHISITPKIVDGNADNLPGIIWDTKSSTSKDEQKQINDIFTKLDSTHKTIAGFTILEPKVVSALSNAADSLYSIFNNHKQLTGDDYPFKADVVGGLKEKDEIQQANFEQVFKDLQARLDKFNTDNKNRFTVKYTIEKLDNKHAVISYEVTDTQTKESTTDTTAGSTLDNIEIIFNGSLDKGQSWLDKLSRSLIDKSDFSTHNQVEAFGKRNPLAMTSAELDKVFIKYEEYKGKAKIQGVTLSPDGVKKVTDINGESTYLQIFKASFADPTDPAKTIDHYVELQFTHNFLTAQEIDQAKSRIDTDAANAQKTIDGSAMTQDQKDKLIAKTEAARKALQDQLTKEGADMSEDKLRQLEGLSSKIPEAATSAAMKAKYDEVHKMLEKEFPDGIPTDVQNLFESHWKDFEDIIKTDPSILHDAKKLAKLLDSLSAENLVNIKRSMQLSGKIAILALGSMLGIGAGIGGANAVKVATTNKKAVNAKTGKIKSSKKLAAISALIGLASLAGSIGTFIYLFVVQGGL